jgi:predicted metalloprotease with PDZ domain
MIHYHLDFEQYGQHLIDVRIDFVAQKDQVLWLPAWIPGSYLLREFSRHVGKVRAYSLQRAGNNFAASNAPDAPSVAFSTQLGAELGTELPVRKTRKNQWSIDCAEGESVRVCYQVYAYDLSVRGAYVDQSRLYVNPACVCLGVLGQEDAPITLTLDAGVAFEGLPLACALPRVNQEVQSTAVRHLSVERKPQPHVLQSKNYSHLIDHPFEIAVLSEAQFEVEGIVHRIAISGRHQADLMRLSQDLSRICQAQMQLFGHAPFDDYLFMVMATGNSYGGLEHQSCTSLITPRDDLPQEGEPLQPSVQYRRFLGLCSHEYLHAWLVKFIRPEGFINPDLNSEVYTSLLWVFEGFTSYYDDLFLCRSGVIDRLAYLDLLSEQISRYQQNPGRELQSLSESSFDAWIKYYRPDENSSNAGTSYYNKGALVALCLDLTLRQKGSSLDALMQALYAHAKDGLAVQENTLAELCEQLVGDRLESFWRDYVEGCAELPLDTLLNAFGVERVIEPKNWPFGMKLVDNPQGVMVQQVLRDSAAAKAGISAHDVIVAVNGLRASSASMNALAERAGEDSNKSSSKSPMTECHLFRRDELHTLRLRVARSAMNACRLSVVHSHQLGKWLADSVLHEQPSAL